MSLFFDVTNATGSRQMSGLIRVSTHLRQALISILGGELIAVVWHGRKGCFLDAASRKPVQMQSTDFFLTAEVFSSRERNGFYTSLENSGVKKAAVFHDAIPYLLPEITWPRSVERHPLYMNDLLRMDHIFCVSESSRCDLQHYWKEQASEENPSTSLVTWGADFFNRSEIPWIHSPRSRCRLVNIGILEPRKNQIQLLHTARQLLQQGCEFELHFVGRVNPYFGKPIAKEIKKAAKSGLLVFHHKEQSDESLRTLLAGTHFTVFTSVAEGFGLPVVESLWLGIPCITSNLPSLRPFVDGVSCISFESEEDLLKAINDWLRQPDKLAEASNSARERILPLWANVAREIIAILKGRL